ncbi:MAG: hypothetical protein ABWX88_08325 [Pseudoxanthomonas sp.]
MNSDYFFAQDQAGGMQRVHVVRHSGTQENATESAKRAPSYVLDDGSALRRIDNDTFQVVDTGALVTLVRD